MVKIKKEKVVIPKPRNNGTMTESAFWSFIRSSIRKASMYWKPLQQCKLEARRAFKGAGRQKWEYQCSECTKWFKEKDIQVDHIVDAGSLRSGDDLKGFVERCFVEAGGYQVLCKPCHQLKTNEVRNEKKLLKLNNMKLELIEKLNKLSNSDFQKIKQLYGMTNKIKGDTIEEFVKNTPDNVVPGIIKLCDKQIG